MIHGLFRENKPVLHYVRWCIARLPCRRRARPDAL